MAASITQLHPDWIWVCGCGCASYELHGDGRAVCHICGATPDADEDDRRGWADIRNQDRDRLSQHDYITTTVPLGVASLARERTAKQAHDPDTVGIVVLKADGTIKSWADIRDQDAERIRWWREQLETAKHAFVERKTE